MRPTPKPKCGHDGEAVCANHRNFVANNHSARARAKRRLWHRERHKVKRALNVVEVLDAIEREAAL